MLFSFRNSQIIPILERQTFNVLAKRFNEQSDLFLSKAYGSDRGDYLLFNGLGKNRFSRLLREAYQEVRLNPKSPHCCRHTYATNFAGIAHADTMLCRLVLGHKDEDTTLGYVHLFEQINRQSRSKELTKTKIKLL